MILEQEFIQELHTILQKQTSILLFEDYKLQNYVRTHMVVDQEFFLPKNAVNSVIKLQSVREVWIALCIDKALHAYMFNHASKDLFIPESERPAYMDDFAAEFENLIVGHTLSFIRHNDNRIGTPKIRVSEAAIHQIANVNIHLSEIHTNKGLARLYSIVPARYYNQNLETIKETHHV